MRCCSFFILQHKPQTSDTLLAQPIASHYHTHSTHSRRPLSGAISIHTVTTSSLLPFSLSSLPSNNQSLLLPLAAPRPLISISVFTSVSRNNLALVSLHECHVVIIIFIRPSNIE